MPKVQLTSTVVANPPAPKSSSKVNYFDTIVPGFLVEVRSTGKSTYYQRYRDRSGRLKQVRIGQTDSLSLDEARQKARYLRSQSVMGLDPNAEAEKYKQTPTFREFIEDSYLPHVMVHKRSWAQDGQPAKVPGGFQPAREVQAVPRRQEEGSLRKNIPIGEQI